MNIELSSPMFRGAVSLNLRGVRGLPAGQRLLPSSFRGPREEMLATRTAATLGLTLSQSPVYDVYGPDVIPFLNSVTVNRDWALLKPGASRHAVITNDRGQMLADGVGYLVAESRYRTYWLAPVLEYLMQESSFDVTGEWITDEFFLQLDGPKSLNILQELTGANLSGLRFARNTKAHLAGTEITIHRLGMSGALAYELHGDRAHEEAVYARLREAVEAAGGSAQGSDNYATILHTPAGYPNQYLHFLYPYRTSGEGLSAAIPDSGLYAQVPIGSASTEPELFYMTPYDVGWGGLIDLSHNFPGRDALAADAERPRRTMVTLEWNADDVAQVFASQFRGIDVEPTEPIENPRDIYDPVRGVVIRGDYVLHGGRAIGIATGRTIAYWERRMISLACLESDEAIEGREVTVLWGTPGTRQTEIRALIAPFPYYQGPYRNETFDTTVAE